MPCKPYPQLHCYIFPCLQTKGVKNYVTIDQNKGAWIAAVGAAGAALVGSLLVWPLMRNNLKKYDNQQAGGIEAGKDAVEKSVFVEQDKFQQAVMEKLKPVEVDPADKSIGAFFKRFRCVELPVSRFMVASIDGQSCQLWCNVSRCVGT